MTRRSVSSPERRWRPRDRKGPVCGYSFDGKVCQRKGAHYCEPRADRVVAFFAELLVHTKGRFARQAFVLEDWQECEVVRPVFGEVVWSPEWGGYVRRHRVVYIVLGRKNGKSELAAGIVLYLLVGDDEEAAEVYGAAKDTKQAGKVADVVERMRQLSPTLAARLKFNKNARRVYDERTGSYYEVITADALGELGHNPHGFVLDEVLSQPDGSLWDSMRTAAGTRSQPMFLVITTETNDPSSFGAQMIDEAERIAEDPSRTPHAYAYVRKTPMDADPWDEANWAHANPALGSFLSVAALREEALEARNDPTKENAFRQYRLNQRVQQVTRFIPIHLWDENAGEVWPNPEWRIDGLKGRKCWAGLDLSAKLDMTAWCLAFPDGDTVTAWWRFWLPEAALPQLNDATGGQLSVWADQGWLTVTDGDVIDYQQVYADIETDHRRFGIANVDFDRWSGEPVRQEIERRTGLGFTEVEQTFRGLSESVTETMRLLTAHQLRHLGNPVARWHADSLEVRTSRDNPDLVRPSKPDRRKSGKRIDGMPTLFMAVGGWKRGEETKKYRAAGF